MEPATDPFPLTETLRALLAERRLSGLLVIAERGTDPDLAAFTGGAHLHHSLILAGRDGRPRLGFLSPMEREEAAATGLDLLTPELLDMPRWNRDLTAPAEVLEAVLGQALLLAGIHPGPLALAGHRAAGEVHAACRALEKEGYAFVPGHELVLRLRKAKTAAQVAEIRRVAHGTGAAFQRVAGLLAAAVVEGDSGELHTGGAPLTVGRLRAEIAAELALARLEQPEGNLVAPAEEGAVPHSTGRDERVLRAGESLIVDLYPRGRSGFFADCTRTFCVGAPPEPLARAHAAVREALSLVYDECREGVRGWDVQQAVCRHFEGLGYATQVSDPVTTVGYVHGLGHGVGLEVHEYPSFRRQAGQVEGRLEEGDVFTLEPGLYDAGERYGLRLEDLVRLGPDGLENLTPLPYDLDPRAWSSQRGRR